MDKIVDKYAGLFRSALKGKHFLEIDRKVSQYGCRLAKMCSSDAYREHNAYPTMNVEKIYAVIEMFQYYGIRSLCKIFCMTDEFAYSMLPKHVQFIRHSDLSDGDSCHDEIMDKQ